MNLSIDVTVSAITVFLQGALSFLSPCVLPMLPLYLGYLSGQTTSEPTTAYSQRKTFLHTVCFVIGISFAFLLLGFGVTSLGHFFSSNRSLFAKLGGGIIIVLGLFQLGLFSPFWLNKERRLPFSFGKLAMNPFTAFLMGFTFSFAWTPCVGPTLTSVLLLASSSSAKVGLFYIGIYTLGFIVPFLAVGLFTSKLLLLFQQKRAVAATAKKIGALLLIFTGLLMVTGGMNRLSIGLANISSQNQSDRVSPDMESNDQNNPSGTSPSATEDSEKMPAPDFTLYDQFGVQHTLSEYKGKVVFLNFWASWCGPCKQEMPDIQALYESYQENQEDVIFLGVANPATQTNPFQQDVSPEEITAFLSDNHYTYPTAMDLTGEVLAAYGISAFPTTFMIDADGNIFGYVPGALTKDVMENIIEQTKEQSK